VQHDGGALPVRAPRYVGVPAGFDQAHECVDGVGEGWWVFCRGVLVVVVGDERVAVGLQCGVEGGGFVVGQGDAPAGGVLAVGLGDRAGRIALR
jgi:hypothetical protein